MPRERQGRAVPGGGAGGQVQKSRPCEEEKGPRRNLTRSGEACTAAGPTQRPEVTTEDGLK